MVRFVNHAFLLESEDKARKATHDVFPGFCDWFPQLLDAFFRLPYFIEHPADPDTDVSHFRSWAFYRYTDLPYTCRMFCRGWETAYYLEAAVLLRHILEAFIQTRYFVEHSDRIKAHLLGTKRVTFRTMFDAFSPGYYEKHYGRLLSGMAHSGLATSVFLEAEPDGQGGGTVHPRYGCEFREDSAAYLLNGLLPLLLGFLNYFPVCFPSYSTKADEATETMRRSAVGYLANWKTGHAAQYAKAAEWHGMMDQMIGLK